MQGVEVYVDARIAEVESSINTLNSSLAALAAKIPPPPVKK